MRADVTQSFDGLDDFPLKITGHFHQICNILDVICKEINSPFSFLNNSLIKTTVSV